MPTFKATVIASAEGSCRALVETFEVWGYGEVEAVHAASSRFIAVHRVDPDILTIDLEEIG